jgi:hypothetical protein
MDRSYTFPRPWRSAACGNARPCLVNGLFVCMTTHPPVRPSPSLCQQLDMPIDHLVLLKVTPDAAPSAVLAMEQAFVSLQHSVPGVQSVTMGRQSASFYKDQKDRSDGFTHAFTVRVDDAKALERSALPLTALPDRWSAL